MQDQVKHKDTHKDKLQYPAVQTQIAHRLIFSSMAICHSLSHNDVNPISHERGELWVLPCLDLVFHAVSRWLIPSTGLLTVSQRDNGQSLSCPSINTEGKETQASFFACLLSKTKDFPLTSSPFFIF